MKKIFAFLLCALCVAPFVAAQPLARVAPQQVGIDPERMLNADRIILDAINNQEIPGAVLAVVKDGKMAYLKAYGNRRIVPNTEPMTANTILSGNEFQVSNPSVSGSTTLPADIHEPVVTPPVVPPETPDRPSPTPTGLR